MAADPHRNTNARYHGRLDPVLFGTLQAAYLIVYRKQTTMLQDPYSLGYCIIFRFESRVGGNIVCGNACRLLRVK